MYYYVYKTTNKINGKFYIGVHKHFTPHDKSYIGSGITLRHAIAKHGIENFHNEVLKYFDTHDDAFLYEAELVTDELINTDECYNMVRGGKGGGLTKPFLSKERLEFMRRPKSEATKKKISEKLMGKCYITEDGLRRISEKSKGNQYAKGNSHKLTDATKANMSKARMGIKYSEITIQRMRAAKVGTLMGDENPMASAENREKVRQSKIGLRVMYNEAGEKRMARPGTPKSDMLLAQGFAYK